jgi:DNA-binding transcriptional ArsR family regulator
MSLEGERDRVQAELRAVAHPTRLRILSLLTGAEMTAAEVARELQLTQANASYHMRQLAAVGQISVAAEERINGGLAKRYRYVYIADSKPLQASTAGLTQLPQRRALAAAVGSELLRRANFSRDTPGRSHLTDAELWVTPEVWAEMRERVIAASAQLHEAAQPPRTPGTIRVNATIVLFEMESNP